MSQSNSLPSRHCRRYDAGMESLHIDLIYSMSWWTVALAAGITLGAGFVKGAVGFAMPMIMISGFGSFMHPELALAALIVPAVVSNLWQAFRQGALAAANSAQKHWRYLAMLVLFLVISAQFVKILPTSALFLILGVPVTLFAFLQLVGWSPKIRPGNRLAAELGVGAFSGAIGGLSGVWGPPTVLYLTALETPKAEHVRVQGVIYGTGAVMLALAHVQSGVLTAETAKFSFLMTVPALLGMAIGFAVHDRLDQKKFRRATLFVLVVAGLNLVRRGLGA